MAGDEIFKNLGESNLSGFQEFYTAVLYGKSNNFFTARNKARISWHVLNNSTISYKPDLKIIKTADILQKSLNAIAYYADTVNLPDTIIKLENFIDDGRGAYLPNSESIEVPSSSTFSITFKEQMQPEAMSTIDCWLRANAIPFCRPALANCMIDHMSDRDGKSIMLTTVLYNCRPIGFEHIKFSHNNREIATRAATFGFDRTIDFYTTGKGSQQRQTSNAKVSSIVR